MRKSTTLEIILLPCSALGMGCMVLFFEQRYMWHCKMVSFRMRQGHLEMMSQSGLGCSAIGITQITPLRIKL